MAVTVLLANLPGLLDDIVSGALEYDEGIGLVRNTQAEDDLAATAVGVEAVARERPKT
jgi:hypothetical protein